MIRSALRRAMACLSPLLAATSLLLTACGGGGGGGASDLRITLDRSAIAFDYREDAPPAPAQVVAMASGTLPSAIYVLVIDEGTSIDPSIPATFDTNTATFTIRPKAGLAPGTYTGRLQLSACSDSACANRIGGTPLPVTYTITVRPTFKVEPGSLRITAMGGRSASAILNAQLPAGAAALDVVPGSLPPWLTVIASGNRLDIVTKPWRAGTYTATLELAAGTERRFVPVTYEVTMPPGGEWDLSVYPTSVTLVTTSENAVGRAWTISVFRPSWTAGSAVPWRIEYAPGGPTGWLQVTDVPDGLSMATNASTLRQGNYQATIVLEPPAPGTSLRLPVAATVGPGLMAPPAVALTADAESTALTLRGQWNIHAVAGPAFTWRAVSNQPWLRLSAANGTTSGSTGTVLAYEVDTAAMAPLANFADHTATVTLTPDPAHITPVEIPITLAKRLPEVHAIGPQLLVTQRTTAMYVSGRGFGAVASPAARLSVAGLVPDAVTRVNDRTLKVTLTPQVPGTSVVSVGNALDQAQSSTTMRAIGPQAFAYAAVPSGGNPRAIVLDPARATVYGVNVGTEALQRFRLQGNGSWVVDAKPMPQILDAGMSADGESMIVTATPGPVGRLRLVDPATLDTTFTLDHAAGFARNLTYVGFGITTTHDGRAWIPTGTGGWNELGYFDLRTRTLQPRPEQPGFTSTFYGGPWMATSRDGNRMIVVQSASISSSPPMLGYTPLSRLFTPEPSGQTFSYDIHLSTDGSRAIFDGNEVRAADGALIGRVSLAAFPRYYGLTGLMAPEGHRAYVLAMHEDPLVKPRVFVFDTRAPNPTSVDLTLVGYFDLQNDPTCRTGAYECNQRARAAISPDGATLFFLGDQHLVVQPVEASLRSLDKTAVRDLRPQGADKPLRWSPAGVR